MYSSVVVFVSYPCDTGSFLAVPVDCTYHSVRGCERARTTVGGTSTVLREGGVVFGLLGPRPCQL